MQPTTPKGLYTLWIFFFSSSACSLLGLSSLMAALSHPWLPRSSPLACGRPLPCSFTRSSIRESALSARTCDILPKYSLRSSKVLLDHAGNALRASFTASSSSSREHDGAWPTTDSSNGLITSKALLPATCLPPIIIARLPCAAKCLPTCCITALKSSSPSTLPAQAALSWQPEVQTTVGLTPVPHRLTLSQNIQVLPVSR
mmetsp:Transcript_528/g.1325  ORF Transcript_528/g.1325 Transcript_528/m.1325 type:complete len:201 (+) Transcript_528:1152-1754(+)